MTKTVSASGHSFDVEATSMTRLLSGVSPVGVQIRPDADAAPWRWIAKLYITFATKKKEGTAWMCGPRTLATAGHNLWDSELGSQKSIRVEFSLGTSSNVSMIASEAHPNEAWTTDFQKKDDFGVIVLPDDPGMDYFDFATFPHAFGSKEFCVCGYPEYRTKQLGFAGPVQDADSTFVYYDFPTLAGMSGGPLFGRWGNKYIVGGIHAYADTPDNFGHRIDQRVYDYLMQFR